MKYFLHDTSSFDDEKITLLYLEHGFEGLGLFYTALEKIGKQEKPINTIALKSQLKVGKRLEKCWLFMEEIELIHSNNGETFNEQLLIISEKYQIKKEKNRKKVSEWRERQKDKKDVTGNEKVRNQPKVKERKGKLNKEEGKEEPSDFKLFWTNEVIKVYGTHKPKRHPTSKIFISPDFPSNFSTAQKQEWVKNWGAKLKPLNKRLIELNNSPNTK